VNGLKHELLEVIMADRVYKKISVTGCSTESIERAIEAAVRKAGESIHGMAWFELTELRGAIQGDEPAEWQATVDVAFKVD
jgi:flavin-binding protein dodecin